MRLASSAPLLPHAQEYKFAASLAFARDCQVFAGRINVPCTGKYIIRPFKRLLIINIVDTSFA